MLHSLFTIYYLDPVHRVKEIFALSINAHAEFFTFAAQPLLQFGGTLPRPGAVGDDNHSKLLLHHGLIDVNNTAAGFRQYLSNAGNNARMVDPKHRNDHSVGSAFRRRRDNAAARRKRL